MWKPGNGLAQPENSVEDPPQHQKRSATYSPAFGSVVRKLLEYCIGPAATSLPLLPAACHCPAWPHPHGLGWASLGPKPLSLMFVVPGGGGAGTHGGGLQQGHWTSCDEWQLQKTDRHPAANCSARHNFLPRPSFEAFHGSRLGRKTRTISQARVPGLGVPPNSCHTTPAAACCSTYAINRGTWGQWCPGRSQADPTGFLVPLPHITHPPTHLGECNQKTKPETRVAAVWMGCLYISLVAVAQGSLPLAPTR